MAIRLAIADDHTMFREGLRRLLETRYDMKVVAEAGNGEEAIAAARSASPDVVLMDIDMPVLDGITATERIVETHPDVGIIVVTMHDEDEFFLRAVRAGARGFVLKSSSAEEMARVIRTVAAGKSQLDPDRTMRLVEDYRRLASSLNGRQEEALTERQRDILRLISTGASNREIAEQLAYAEKTIKNELTEIYRKLDVRDRTQAAVEAVRRGLVAKSD